MHDTAFQIGSLAMNIYADLRTDAILEVGSQSVNGSLRDNALPTTRYTGVDIEEGEGVDIVVEPNKPLPVEDDSFDLVIASSVFEHDPFFWSTFLEMCRATKQGGYIYINAPSNGLVHRYPQDNWRFYPDAGRALAQWAVSQGMAITLVESFIAKREKDIWNDFVAVFRKGRITKTLPKVFLHEHVSCTDVITWKSKDITNPSERTEDVILLHEAVERARAAEDELASVTDERSRLEREAADLQRRLSEAESIRGELTLRESELRQRQEEIEQTRSELLHARSRIEELCRELSELRSGTSRLDELKMRVEARLDAQQQLNASLVEQLRDRELEFSAKKAESESLTAKLKVAEADFQSAKLRLSDSQRRIEGLEERLRAHFHETGTLSRIILECQESAAKQAEKAQRIRELYEAVISQPRWWWILSPSRRSRLQSNRLRRLGLFDGHSYLGKNPDVAEAGEDPFHHYVHHGIDENRPGVESGGTAQHQ
jgi:SAM-dependent methyltransferase